jgi:tRNA nucleotidyltransferase/poly(A) polymerase
MSNKLTEWLVKPLLEDIKIPVEIGDTILMGRFKNKKVKVKSIGYNEKGDLLINNRTALKFRIVKTDKKLLPHKTTDKDSVSPDGDMRGVKKFEVTENKVSLNVPGDVKRLHQLFKKNKKQLYIVGGAVRDAILGKKPKDFDMATDAKPDEVLKIAKSGGFKTYSVGKKFGVVIVGGHEIATFRKDIGKGRRPKAVDFSDIQGDVKRRDLTINSLFFDIGRGEVVDLTGGLEDLKNKLIRTVGSAKRRFDEDPLRKLRALRFQAVVGGKMDKETEKALLINPSLKGVSAERIRDEFIKGIKKGKSSKLFMEALDKFRFTKQIFPQLNIQKPYPNVKDYILFLATIFRKNDVTKLPKILNKLKYSSKESNNITFLVYLNNFNPKNIYNVKKAQEKTTLTPKQIQEYGKLIGKDFKKLSTFQLSVKGGGTEFVGLKGKEIGDKIKDIEMKLYMNENILNERKAGFDSVHTKSAFSSLFGGHYAKHVPLTTKFMQSILGRERVSVFHVSSVEGAEKIGRIIGKKSALSTFTKVDKGEKLAKGRGIQTQGGVVFQLEGSLLVASTRDMQTHPDKTGRRWVSPDYLAGKVAGGKMYKEIQNGIKKLKIDYDTWYRIERDLRDKIGERPELQFTDSDGKPDGTPKYDLVQPIYEKELNKIKAKWIKKYIDMCYKVIRKYKPQIKRHILSQKDKPSEYGWNEIIVNQIHVQDVFLIDSLMYKNPGYRDPFIKKMEKIAKGKVTVGKPGQFRKWFNERGGVINEEFGVGAIPSPSRKGINKNKTDRMSGYKKVKESLPNKVKDKIKKVKDEPGSEIEKSFSGHHAGSQGSGNMGKLAEPDTYDGDDDGTKHNKPGHQTKKNKKKRGYEPVTEEKSKIKKVIGIYGGRFQPFGPHHYKTYKWLESQVDEAYITTSDIKKPPRHPMNFTEKVRHMVKIGVPKNRIVKEKTPYVANNTLKKFDPETTAVVYIFGKKDAGRLKGGKKKSGGKTYYQDYKKNKKNLVGYEEHGYILTAPHQSIKVGGQEVSGTVMRNLLGSPKIDDKDRPKLFKQAFGYFDKGVYNMMTNKFRKLFEVFDNFIIHNDLTDILKENSTTNQFPIDDGPPTFYDGFSDYKKHSKKWIKSMYSSDDGLGWELVSYILSKNANDPGLDFTTRMDKVPTVAYGRRGAGPYGERFPSEDPVKAYKKWLEKVVSGLEFEIVKWFGLTDNERDVTGVPVEAPALPGVQTQDQNTQRAIELDLAPGDDSMGDAIDDIQESFMKDIELLIEGGAYGHMAHPFDDNNLTFSDLKQIVINGIGGKLDREDGVTEKLDGQNLMVSWIDGKLKAARNKGHLKNFGKTAPDTKGIASIFKGRGEIKKAFVGAMKDLEKAIGSLSDKQKEKVFGNGKRWMNLEVMYPQTANVIDYDVAEIVFHGTLEYDDSGRPVGQPKDSARMLAGMIKQVNQNVQKTFKIGKPNFLKVPKHQNFDKLKTMYMNRIKKLQSEYALSDKDTLGMYHESYWREYIYNASKQFKVKLKPTQFAKLVKRWAYFDKSYKIQQIKKDFGDNEKFLDWILKTDKFDHNKIFKDNIKPFEVLFFDVGAQILKNISGFMAANPDMAVQKVRKEMNKAYMDLSKKGNIEKLKKLKTQIQKLNAIGGLKSIVPSEGIVFKYKGKVYKFTGAFAPINQILGSLKFG